MKPIGGYFELELPHDEEYHKNAIRLNTGRNAFEYILKAKDYKKVYLPYYTCDVMLEPIHKMKIDYAFYHIDQSFRPVFDFSNLKQNEVFVYNNYFGICDVQTREVASQCKNLIIDNSQAFYSFALPGIDTFYSPRKFFGIPDGSYLYTDKLINNQLERDISYQRFEHLLGRADRNAEEFYNIYKENDASLSNQPIKLMSNITQKMLSSIDYNTIAYNRKYHFNLFHSQLQSKNNLCIDIDLSTVPMTYPLLLSNGKQIKEKLIKNKVYVATYWPNIMNHLSQNCIESEFVDNLICIPINQRLTVDNIIYILELIDS